MEERHDARGLALKAWRATLKSPDLIIASGFCVVEWHVEKIRGDFPVVRQHHRSSSAMIYAIGSLDTLYTTKLKYPGNRFGLTPREDGIRNIAANELLHQPGKKLLAKEAEATTEKKRVEKEQRRSPAGFAEILIGIRDQ